MNNHKLARRSVLTLILVLFTLPLAGTPAVAMSGNGTVDDPYQIETADDLQSINNDLDAHYEIISDIEASETEYWNGLDGFEPIGSSTNPFNGSLQGNGHNVSGLVIDRPNSKYVGLVAVNTGEISGIRLVDVYVAGRGWVGGIAGTNRDDGEIVESSVTGSIETSSNSGGIVGVNRGTVARTKSDVNHDGHNHLGGIVGYNTGIVRNSFATGSIRGDYDKIGGIIGVNDKGTVYNSYSTVEIQSSGAALVGYTRSGSEIVDSFALNGTGDRLRVGGSTTGRVTYATAAEMRNTSLYTERTLAGYDDLDISWSDTIWNFGGDSFPELDVFATTDDSTSDTGTTEGGTTENNSTADSETGDDPQSAAVGFGGLSLGNVSGELVVLILGVVLIAASGVSN